MAGPCVSRIRLKTLNKGRSRAQLAFLVIVSRCMISNLFPKSFCRFDRRRRCRGRGGYSPEGSSSLPSGEAIEHVLCGHRLLTHPGCRRLHSHNHATVVVHQIVVVIAQSGWRAALGGIGGIGIRGRHLVLLMHRFFHRVLLFQFLHILTHRMVDLGRFQQLLPRNTLFELRHEIPCIEYPLSEDESLQFILSHHRTRCGWNAFVRIRLALTLEPSLQQRALDNMRAGGK